ncbi:exosortase A [Nitrosomonas sp. HPC101]|uniref:exosortase A n=1 Tax=Nitrosomonas sp. HPC101 TaxID=1658667 RepID=UPI001368AE01|nr:exosortase A [Nitrosomonas sp. HPC101]MXS85191.1 exosortase A [Nitrosomonas sp. HPC101]
MDTQIQLQSATSGGDTVSRRRAVIWITLLVIVLILGVYHETIGSIVAIWDRSDTYAHGYLILPFSLYMIWKKRAILATVEYHPNYIPLLVLIGLGLGWLLASLANVVVVEQYTLVAMIPVIVWAMLGYQAFSTILFPLAYLLFAVPFGEAFIPQLIDFTADFTVNALQITGVPVYREGNFFSIPSGNWSVVEACSGVRYLIASVTLGTLYAYLTYYSISRRLIFIAFSIVVPIVANGVRAYLIVMTGHLSDMTLAVGVDHLVYGWIFFGLVMLLLFWVGSFWREDHPDEAVPVTGFSSTDLKLPSAPVKSTLGMAGLVIVVATIWPFYMNHLNSGSDLFPIPEISISDPSGKWSMDPVPLTDWMPGYTGSPRQFIGHFHRENQHVGLYITYYRNQNQNNKLISSSNVLVTDRSSGWRNVDGSRRDISVGSTPFTVHQNQLHASVERLLIWRWFWLAGHETADPYVAKMIQALNLVQGNGDDGAEIIITAGYAHDPEEAAAVLREFITDMKPVITGKLQTVHGMQTD